MKRVVLILSLALPGLLYAQSGDLLSGHIDDVVVTATGTPHTLKDVPVQTEVVSRKQIEQLGASSFQDILEQLCPGFDFNAGDMGSQMTMNGLGNSYILILIDGKRLHGDNGGENDLGLIDPNNIDHIEIVKGAGSALYGSDAIAGVINVITRRHDSEGLYLENTTRTGSFMDLRQHNSIGFSVGKLTSLTNFQLQHTDGWQNTGEEDPAQTEFHIFDSKNKTVNRYTNWQVAERLTYSVTDRLSLYAEGSLYGKRIFRPTDGKYPSCDVNTFDMMYRDASASIGGGYDLQSGDRITLDVDWNRHAYYYRYTATTLEDGYDPQGDFTHYFPYFAGQSNLQSDQQRAIATLKGVFALPHGNTLNGGAEFRYDYLNAPMRVFDGTADDWTASIYAQDEYNEIEWLNVTAGIRLTQNRRSGFNAAPKLSVMLKTGEWRFRAGWSRGFKSPTPKELYYKYLRTMGATTFLYVGNTNLKAQTSDYWSTSIEYSHGGFTASVTGYLNKLDNMITLVNIPVSEIPQGTAEYMGDGSAQIVPRQYRNMDNARTYGADVSVTWRITSDLTVGAGYSYLDTEANLYDANHDRMKHVIIDGMAHHKGNIYSTWQHRFSDNYRLGLGIYGRASSTRYYQNNGDGKAYQLWRLTTAHDIGKGRKGVTFRVEAGIDNIFNYVDRTPHGLHLGTTNAGRTWYCTLSVRFTHGRKMDTRDITRESGYSSDDE